MTGSSPRYVGATPPNKKKRFVLGTIWIIIGVLVMKYTYILTQFTGRFDWAERYFSGGFGGTYFFYRLFGLTIIIFAGLYMFGILDNLFGSLGGVFGGIKEE